jgi:hypothetical protein
MRCETFHIRQAGALFDTASDAESHGPTPIGRRAITPPTFARSRTGSRATIRRFRRRARPSPRRLRVEALSNKLEEREKRLLATAGTEYGDRGHDDLDRLPRRVHGRANMLGEKLKRGVLRTCVSANPQAKRHRESS